MGARSARAGQGRTRLAAGGCGRRVPGQRQGSHGSGAAAASGWAAHFLPAPLARPGPRCPVRGARGCSVLRASLQPRAAPFPARLPMSLPVVLPGSCCPVAGLSGGPQAGGPGATATAAQEPPLPPLRPRWPRAALQPPVRSRCSATAAGVLAVPPALSSRRAAAVAPSSALLPGRPLLSLGLLQLILGCCMVALSFGALSLSSSPQVKNSCPFWAGSSVSAARPSPSAGPTPGCRGSARFPPRPQDGLSLAFCFIFHARVKLYGSCPGLQAGSTALLQAR